MTPSRCLAPLGWLALLSACEPKPPNATPEGAVRELAIHLELYHDGRPEEAAAAYALLAKETQANLAERAERYGHASGKRIDPALMLASASFMKQFEPRELTSRITGQYAVVVAQGLLPEERAEIPCVWEDGGWRVRIELPALPPVKVLPRETETRK